MIDVYSDREAQQAVHEIALMLQSLSERLEEIAGACTSPPTRKPCTTGNARTLSPWTSEVRSSARSPMTCIRQSRGSGRLPALLRRACGGSLWSGAGDEEKSPQPPGLVPCALHAAGGRLRPSPAYPACLGVLRQRRAPMVATSPRGEGPRHAGSHRAGPAARGGGAGMDGAGGALRQGRGGPRRLRP